MDKLKQQQNIYIRALQKNIKQFPSASLEISVAKPNP